MELTVKELFDKYDSEYKNFDAVKNKRSSRRDLHAFLLLAEIDPSRDCIVSGAEHDEIELSPNNDFLKTLTDSQVLELVRCGVIYDNEEEYLKLFA